MLHAHVHLTPERFPGEHVFLARVFTYINTSVVPQAHACLAGDSQPLLHGNLGVPYSTFTLFHELAHVRPGAAAHPQEMMVAEENIFVVLRLMCLLSVTQARPPYYKLPRLLNLHLQNQSATPRLMSRTLVR